MSGTERARQKIESQLSQGREATLEGLSKEMKGEISWTFVKDGFEVSATHRDDGTYDLTIREQEASSLFEEDGSSKEVTDIESQFFLPWNARMEVVRERPPLHLTSTTFIHASDRKHACAHEIREFVLDKTAIRHCRVVHGVVSDVVYGISVPVVLIPDAEPEKMVEVTSRVIEELAERYEDEELEIAKETLESALHRGSFTDEEIEGIAKLAADEGLIGDDYILFENGIPEVVDDFSDDVEAAKYFRRHYLRRADKESEFFRIRSKGDSGDEAQIYRATGGSDFTLLVPLPPNVPTEPKDGEENGAEGEGCQIVRESHLSVTVFENGLPSFASGQWTRMAS